MTLKRLLPTKDIYEMHDLENLHISLSHPLGLRRSQIATFLSELSKAVKDVKKTIQPMTRSTSNISSSHETSEMGGDEKVKLRLSLAGNIKVYYNGKKTGGQGDGGRTFFALRLGAGDPELRNLLSKAVEPTLAKFHLPNYHLDPELHSSFAWCLLNSPTSSLTSPSSSYITDQTLDHLPSDVSNPNEGHEGTSLTCEDLKEINEKFSRRIIDTQPKGGWEVDRLVVKIAKELHYISL
ncbi:hypothetical protein M231_01476 [Tremella mesenterica]|uniref:U6 snRNA phosphodiesterase 1 n=1 Tax=Tremella mesenterica TaxID=5217 RepID=A0A4Q1BTH9_TREME|nr:hypothetical protein M231_01476 [Tremella mesenterica]